MVLRGPAARVVYVCLGWGGTSVETLGHHPESMVLDRLLSPGFIRDRVPDSDCAALWDQPRLECGELTATVAALRIHEMTSPEDRTLEATM